MQNTNSGTPWNEGPVWQKTFADKKYRIVYVQDSASTNDVIWTVFRGKRWLSQGMMAVTSEQTMEAEITAHETKIGRKAI